MSSKWTKVLTGVGLLLIAAALALTGYNMIDARRAAEYTTHALEELNNLIPASENTVDRPAGHTEKTADSINPAKEMPVAVIDGNEYIGRLEIQALSLSLPVISEWSYPRLKTAPCRYTGSAYQDNLIIAAHNYSSHFGKLSELREGDMIEFTDIESNRFTYTVTQIEELPGTAIEEMQAGEWDLTLFTCTLGGRSRVTVRCSRTIG